MSRLPLVLQRHLAYSTSMRREGIDMTPFRQPERALSKADIITGIVLCAVCVVLLGIGLYFSLYAT